MSQPLDTLAPTFLAYLQAEQENQTIDYTIPLTPLSGGFETQIYHFQLSGTHGAWAGPLILRLYPPRYGTRNAVWESTVQNTLAAAGYPVPKVHLVCTEMAVLGGAFFVMDFLPGAPLIAAPPANVPVLLGQSHAELHQIDPRPLIAALAEQHIDERNYRLESRFDELIRKAPQHPHLRPAIDWLLSNRPPEPTQLAICHGDFHPLNLLIENGMVSGVLDWPGFVISDPAMDVATTLVLVTVPIKQIAPQIGLDFPPAAVEPFVRGYLEAYRAVRPLETTHLEYYQVFRAVKALIEGAEGQTIWQHPAIVAELVAYVDHVTAIRLAL